MKQGAYFEVEGGHKLMGTIKPQGAKNEALQVIAAVLLTDEPVILNNVPDILDIQHLIRLLVAMGVEVKQLGANKYQFQAQNVHPDNLLVPEAAKLAGEIRGSILLLGPLLARFGKAYLYKPGGDKIGRRRIDTHIEGFEALGATVNYDAQNDIYILTTNKPLTGNYLLLDEASVTGTANLVMAAVLAEGKTTLYNAACEPYLQQLCSMLVSMGAEINGIGSNLLTIYGKSRLKGTSHTLLADMIEVGSFMGMAAMVGGGITIQDACVHQLGILPRTFQRLGLKFNIVDDDIIIPEQDICRIESFLDGSILTIADHTWPGLSPDLLSILLVVATQCEGTVLIHQKMFESRLFFVDKLIDMGAQVILCDPHRATVIGLAKKTRLKAIALQSPDIRAGVALLIAALSAEGKSKIYNISQIDRGYQQIEQRLQSLGANITRFNQE